ncbi:MAG TPA: aryl-sulfate sulfotransferase [Candidatus Sulfotelmatobacter sp.]|nr:aryl-sulfate sulfotransferase [Candidatus Sulfotelmatobacter sp.]
MRPSIGLKLLCTFTLAVATAFTVACGGAIDHPTIGSAVTGTANPLVARVTVVSGCVGKSMVEFGPDTSYGRSTSWFPVAGQYKETNIFVAGMRASTTYHLRSQTQCTGITDNVTSPDMTFKTGAIPSLLLPTMTVTRPSPSTSSPENAGVEMITVASGNVPAFFTDRDGNIIWYYNTGPGSSPYVFKLLPDGNMIVMVTTNPVGTTVGISSLQEIDLAGDVIRKLDISTLDQKMQAAGFDFAPDNFTHDLVPLDNGHVIVLVNYSKNFTDLPGYPGSLAVVGDGVIDLDENWNPVWAWTSFDHLDVKRHLAGLPDWTHGNGLVYLPGDGNLLVSLRHQSWVLKIDYSNGTGTGDILWTLGYLGDMELRVNGIPSTDPSEWFSFQHFPVLISQSGSTTLMGVWDNGDNRVLDTSGNICGGSSPVGCYSRANIFTIDDSAKVADLTWSDSPGMFSVWGGNVNQLPNGNVEFDVNAPYIPTVPNSGSIVEEVTQTSSPQIVWQMAIGPSNMNAYRAYRVPSLYNGVTWQY